MGDLIESILFGLALAATFGATWTITAYVKWKRDPQKFMFGSKDFWTFLKTFGPQG